MFFGKYARFALEEMGDSGLVAGSLLRTFVNSEYEKQVKVVCDGVEYSMYSSELEEEFKATESE